MTSGRRKYLLLAIAFIGLLALVGYLGSDRGMHGLVRPVLERGLSASLGAQVTIGGFDLDLRRLRIVDAKLRRQGQLRLQLQKMEIEYSWRDLFRRKLAKVHLVAPELDIVTTGQNGGSPRQLLPVPPLQIADLVIEQGRMNLSFPGRQFLLRQISFRTRLGEELSFFGTAALGEKPGLPIEVNGQGTWRDGLLLRLERFELDGRSLLASPIELSLATDKKLNWGGRLSWPGFSSADLQQVGSALGYPSLPVADWQFDSRQASLRFGGGGQHGLDLRLSLAGARFIGKGLVLPLEQGSLSLQGQEGLWKGRGDWFPAEGFSGTLDFEFGPKGLQGRAVHTLGGGMAPLQVEFFRNEAGDLSGTGQIKRLTHRQWARLALLLGLKNPLPADLTVGLDQSDFRFDFKGGQWNLQLGIARGLAEKPGLHLLFQQLEASLQGQDNRWEGSGRLRVAELAPVHWTLSSGGGKLSGQLSLSTEDLAETVLKLKGGSRLPVSGALDARGQLAWQQGDWSLKAWLEGRGGTGPGLDISRLKAEFFLEGPLEHLSTDAVFRHQGQVVAAARGPLRRLEFEIPPQTWGQLQKLLGTIGLPAGMEAIDGLAAKGLLALEPKAPWQLQGRLAADEIALKNGRLEAVRLQGRLRPEGDLLLVPEMTVSGGLKLQGLSVGTLDAAMTGSYRSGDFGAGFERLALSGIEYLSPDGLSGLAGGQLELSGKLTGSVKHRRLDWNVQGRGGAGEILHGAFYADFSKLPIRFEFDGDFAGEPGRLNVGKLLLQADGAGQLQLAGGLSAQSQRLLANLQLAPLEGSLAQVLRAALAAFAPPLKDLQFSGALGADMALDRQEQSWQLQGSLRPAEFGLDWPKAKIGVQKCSGLVPLVLSSEASRVERRQGGLVFEGLSLGPASYAGSVSLAATGNWLELVDPLDFNLAGGRLRLEAVEAGVTAKGLEFAGYIDVAGVDLEQLSAELELPRMTGRIDADLGQIRYADGVLSTEGQALVSAFGGSLRIGGLRYQAPFSSYPTLHGDVDFSGLDLHQLTHTFAFGEMNGVVDGYIRNLRLFGRTPSRFVAEIRTRPEGRRNISVKALKNLTLLSQGGLSAALSRGIYRFIDFYRYRQIGIRCSLDRDVFHLRGTALSGSNRHLVYGGLLPPKIDILAPSQAISFKEMVKRLGRIERTGH